MKVVSTGENKRWFKGQELNLPLDFALSLISQGVVEEIKEEQEDVKSYKKSKPKSTTTDISGSESLVEGTE